MTLLVNQEVLKNILDYNPDTGIFTWIGPRGNQKAGAIAGNVWKKSNQNSAYRSIKIFGHTIAAHRVAFLYMTGSIPEEIDHIDNDGLNNKWSNLRSTTRSQNQANVGLRRDNASGQKGVWWNRRANKWQVAICHENKKIHLGFFSDLSTASNTYKQSALKLFGTFAK